MTHLEMAVPFAKPLQNKLSSFLNSYALKDVVSLTPHAKQDFEAVTCQSASIRGGLGSENPSLDFLAFFDRIMPKTASAVTLSQCPVPIGAPYPSHIIDAPFWQPSEKEISLMTLWQSSRNSGQILRELTKRTSKVNLAKLHRFQEGGLDQDSLTEILENLHKASECYEPTSDAI